MLFAAVAVLAGLGLMMWLIVADGSPRAIVVGGGMFMVCAGTGSAVLLRQAQAASNGELSIGGWSARRVSLVMFVTSLVLAAILLAQAPLLPATR